MPLQHSSNSLALGRLVALASLACGCGAGPVAKGPPNVVLICLDTVRADHLSAYGYERDTTPWLADLAARATVFRDASSNAGWTKPSVPSFLTGTLPMQHGVYEGTATLAVGRATDLLADEALTLAEVFQERGYDTAAFVHNAQLRKGFGFEQGFDVYEDGKHDARGLRWSGLDWLDGRADSQAPFFLYLHFLDAHWPYPVPEEYATRYASAEEVAPFRGSSKSRELESLESVEDVWGDPRRRTLEAIYDGALRYLDDQLRLLEEGLAVRGLGDDTVICIVSDHGEEFGEHGKIGHGHGLWQKLLHVPWILYAPGVAPAEVETPVSLIDLFPTLLASVGMEAPDGLPGVDRTRSPGRAEPLIAEHKAPYDYLQSLREADHKLLRRFTPPSVEATALRFPDHRRWEIEFELDGEGRPLAIQIKEREDEPVEDPIELKGQVTRLTEAGFSLGGIPIALDADTEHKLAEDQTSLELREGLLVKVEGEPVEGAFLARRIKLYGDDSVADLELRGPLSAYEGTALDGRVQAAGVWFRVDASTALPSGSVRQRTRRSQVIQLLEQGVEASRARAVALEDVSYDLATDPGELSPRAGDTFRLGTRLENLSEALTARRTFGDDNKLLLDEETIEDLKAIGYGD